MSELNIQNLDLLALDEIFRQLDLEDQINFGLTSKYLCELFAFHLRLKLKNQKDDYLDNLEFWYKDVECGIRKDGLYWLSYIGYYYALGYTDKEIERLSRNSRLQMGWLKLNNVIEVHDFFTTNFWSAK